MRDLPKTKQITRAGWGTVSIRTESKCKPDDLKTASHNNTRQILVELLLKPRTFPCSSVLFSFFGTFDCNHLLPFCSMTPIVILKSMYSLILHLACAWLSCKKYATVTIIHYCYVVTKALLKSGCKLFRRRIARCDNNHDWQSLSYMVQKPYLQLQTSWAVGRTTVWFWGNDRLGEFHFCVTAGPCFFRVDR